MFRSVSLLLLFGLATTALESPASAGLVPAEITLARLMARAEAAYRAGDASEAESQWAQAFDLAKNLGDSRAVARAAEAAATLALRRGQADATVTDRLTAALEAYKATADWSGLASVNDKLAQASDLRGDRGKAEGYRAEARRWREGPNETPAPPPQVAAAPSPPPSSTAEPAPYVPPEPAPYTPEPSYDDGSGGGWVHTLITVGAVVGAGVALVIALKGGPEVPEGMATHPPGGVAVRIGVALPTVGR